MTDPDPPSTSGTIEPSVKRAMFSAMVADAAPVLIGYLDRDERYRFVNRAYETWFGVDRSDIEGRTLLQVLGENAYETVRAYVARALSGEHVTFQGDVPYRDAVRHIEAQYVPDIAPDGTVAGYCVLVTDITERKRDETRMARLLEQERRRTLILDLGRRLREETDPAAIIAKACESLGRQLNATRVGYGEVDFTVTHTDVVGEWSSAASPSRVGTRHVLDQFGTATAEEMRAGRETVIRDVATDPRTAKAAAAGAFGARNVGARNPSAPSIGAYVTFPLIRSGRLVAYFYVVQTEVRDWSDEDLTFIGEVAHLTWSAAERARSDAALTQAEETERLLIREVDHRAKNVLAVVQSLAQLTPFLDKKQYVSALSGRIGSLARSHSLLSSNRWSGARLDVLLQQELEPYGAENDNRLTIEGPAVLIQAEAAQSLGLVIHELATNASKYGALSTSTGALEVSWRWEPERRLVLTWRETGGPRALPPQHQGFGATLIANAGRQVGATITRDWPPEGLVCSIALERGATPYFGTPPTAPAADGASSDLVHTLVDQRILVVEDEALVAMELARILTESGARVIGPAGDVEEALVLIEAGGIDRALLDINLAGRLVTPVAAALTREAIPFVYLTGYQEPEIQGGTVLRKPVNPATLVGALASQVAV